MKPKKHITPAYLLNPTHPVTIALIGCGGTGSQVLTCLGRISYSLQQLGHPGFHVQAYDEDIVSQANIARQLFALNDLGLNKANVLITRINRFFGTCWEAIPNHYTMKTAELANITITCVDTVKAHLTVSEVLTKNKHYSQWEPYLKPYYWLDFGNQANTGQVVLGTVKKLEQPKSKKFKTVAELPMVTERFDLSTVDEASAGRLALWWML